MSHFAEIDKDGIVLRVISTEQSFINSGHVGDSFNWIQTSYNGNFRKQFAGSGYKYDKINDVFISRQPFPSWVLDENFDWVSPAGQKPTIEDGAYRWNEDTQAWAFKPE